jgi:dipeptide/tripeptide permease
LSTSFSSPYRLKDHSLKLEPQVLMDSQEPWVWDKGLMIGGWLADEYWGKFKTIYVAIVVATFGHILILIAAIPQVIASPKGALASFILGLILFGTGVGFFKACISPLIAEQ